MKKTELKIIEKSISKVLTAIGEDVDREGLVDTPSRVARAFDELFSGYRDATNFKVLFKTFSDAIVEIKDLEFWSMCEHHMLPFMGDMDITYKPSKDSIDGMYRVIGLSKIPRLVHKHSHRLTLQEKLGYDIAKELQEITQAEYVTVDIRARHSCVEMRGAKAKCITSTSITVTNKGEVKCQV